LNRILKVESAAAPYPWHNTILIQMTTLDTPIFAPPLLTINIEGDVCRYAVQQIETHIRTYFARIRERMEMYDFKEARSVRMYLRNYWKELLPANRGELNYWGYALRQLIRNFYTKSYAYTLPTSLWITLLRKIDAQIDAQWEYREQLEQDSWLEDLYEEFHPDKVLSKIRIPRKDPREQGTKVESVQGQQTGTA
jgi:hypothetical protein